MHHQIKQFCLIDDGGCLKCQTAHINVQHPHAHTHTHYNTCTHIIYPPAPPTTRSALWARGKQNQTQMAAELNKQENWEKIEQNYEKLSKHLHAARPTRCPFINWPTSQTCCCCYCRSALTASFHLCAAESKSKMQKLSGCGRREKGSSPSRISSIWLWCLLKN